MNERVPDISKVKEVHIMPYSHHDFAWTYSRQWHIHRYMQCFSELLDVMNEYETFTWTIDNVFHSLLPFLEHCPERTEELKRRVKEGRIAIANGGASLVRPTYVGEETYVRNMVAGKRFFQSLFGAGDIDFFLNADVGCGHSQLPQILRLGGHRYYRFQRPEEALDMKMVPRQFVWEGLDGSRILVSRGTYGGFVEGKYVNGDYEGDWERIREQFCREELREKVDELLAADIVWLNYGCDDCRPMRNLYDEPLQLPAFVEEWNRREETKLLFSTPKAYFEKLEKAALPVWQGVLDPVELSYNAPLRGGHSMWRMRQELDRQIVKAESLAVLASSAGAAYPYEALAELWSKLFEIAGHAIEYVFREDFEDLYATAVSAKLAAAALIKRLCGEIAAKLPAADGIQHAVFNSLGWARKEIVQLHIANPSGLDGFELVDGQGRRIPYQIVDICESERYVGYRYTAVDVAAKIEVPALGFAVITAVSDGTVLADRVKAEFIDLLAKRTASILGGMPEGDGEPERGSDLQTIVDNGVLAVVFDRGMISEIRVSASDQTVYEADLDRTFGIGCLKFVQTEREISWLTSWATVDEQAMKPAKWELAENGPLRWVYRVSGTVAGSTFTQDIVLLKGERAIGFDLRLDSAGEEGYFAVDFPADPDTPLHADIPFGVEERNLTNENYASSPESSVNYNGFERGWEGQFYAKSWASYRYAGKPAAIVSGNCSIYYRHDRSNNVVSLVLNRSMPLAVKVERWFNRTHPSIEGKGVTNYRYYLNLPEQDGEYADLAKFAKEKAIPVEAAVKYNAESAHPLPAELSLMQIDAGNVVVTACYKEKDKILLRFYEARGIGSAVNVTPGFRFGGVRIVDLLGNEAEASAVTVDSDNLRIEVNVKPWQIVTLQFDAIE